MRICVYGAASEAIDNKYKIEIEELAKQLALAGHNLIFGGGGSGLMGAAARGFTKGNGSVLGVIPSFISDYEPIYSQCTELIRTQTMDERKKVMEYNADAFLIVPGGIGTFDEFFQILTLKSLNRNNRPIILYNAYGFYDVLDAYIKQCTALNFISPKVLALYKICNNLEDVTIALQGE